MNRFNGRVKTLYEKTHYFLNYQDLTNLKNYYKEAVNRSGFEPEELISEQNAFIRRIKEISSSEIFRTEVTEALSHKHSEAVVNTMLYFSMFDYCENSPQGVWLTRQHGKDFFNLAQKISKESKKKIDTKFNP